MMMRYRFSILLVSISLLFQQSAWAQSHSEGSSSSSSSVKQIVALPPIDIASSMFAMVKGLAICLALLLFVVWLLKKFKSPMLNGQGRSLRIIERLPVGTKSSILLVEVNKRKLLIGVGSEPVSLISDFVDSESLDLADLTEQKDLQKKVP